MPVAGTRLSTGRPQQILKCTDDSFRYSNHRGGFMNPSEKFPSALRGKLLVSCQAAEVRAFRDSSTMARFARAAVEGGAMGIRANGPEDIRAIRQVGRSSHHRNLESAAG